MGCGGSVSKEELVEELQVSERELQEERQRLKEKDDQIASIRDCLQKQLKSNEEASMRNAASTHSVEELCSELQARRADHSEALKTQREVLLGEHQQELDSVLQARDTALLRTLSDRAEQAEREVETHARIKREAVERARAELGEKLSEATATGEAQLSRQRAEADAVEAELRSLRSQVGPLRQEHDQAAQALQEARLLLRSEQAERSSGRGQASLLEEHLVEAQREHLRAEQRHGDLQQHSRSQLRDQQNELQVRAEELRGKDAALQRRDAELAEVNSQLADLQGLFDEVNNQLQSECGRIERLQGAVSVCSRQSKELESLQGMVEESHRMLAQLREALEQERAERLRVAGLLEHEQQRTQLLLDVLKHFKEKLQGLTPQMLLSRLGVTDPKVLASGVGAGAALSALGLNGYCNSPAPFSGNSPAVGKVSLSPCPPVPRPHLPPATAAKTAPDSTPRPTPAMGSPFVGRANGPFDAFGAAYGHPGARSLSPEPAWLAASPALQHHPLSSSGACGQWPMYDSDYRNFEQAASSALLTGR
ncbi:unnamed protein product [Polarella glacialis]|uniref:Uncharacterized protein n=1 Tax=Polarella glacialis TaxID=89957 RepID=A0A813FT88_POLGL|nr:unnamed protein product [Polarella glacialis]